MSALQQDGAGNPESGYIIHQTTVFTTGISQSYDNPPVDSQPQSSGINLESCPPGLQCLLPLDEVSIFLQNRGKYGGVAEIKNKAGQLLFQVAIAHGFGGIKKIYRDQRGMTIFNLKQTKESCVDSCSCCCCCCLRPCEVCNSVYTVEADRRLGQMKSVPGCCDFRLSIHDESGKIQLFAHGCGSMNFETTSGEVIGSIRSKINAPGTFATIVTFPQALDVKLKAILISTITCN